MNRSILLLKKKNMEWGLH